MVQGPEEENYNNRKERKRGISEEAYAEAIKIRKRQVIRIVQRVWA